MDKHLLVCLFVSLFVVYGYHEASVDNCPPTGGKPLMDGLRYGSSPPRQASFLKAFYERKGEKGKRQGLALGKAAPSCL